MCVPTAHNSRNVSNEAIWNHLVTTMFEKAKQKLKTARHFIAFSWMQISGLISEQYETCLSQQQPYSLLNTYYDSKSLNSLNWYLLSLDQLLIIWSYDNTLNEFTSLLSLERNSCFDCSVILRVITSQSITRGLCNHSFNQKKLINYVFGKHYSYKLNFQQVFRLW